MSNIVLFPSPDFDEIDEGHRIDVQQGFMEVYVDEELGLCLRMTEKGEREGLNFWRDRVLQDQADEREYAESLGLTLEEYYETEEYCESLEEYYESFGVAEP